jgi:glycosyltransferase involved in cell wall biosynthesis
MKTERMIWLNQWNSSKDVVLWYKYLKISILGTRGIPACYGGFETFAEQLALYLAARGHNITVYCQSINGEAQHTDIWNGITRVHLPAPDSPLGTVCFDWKSAKRAAAAGGVILTLGYNTAVFGLLYRFSKIRHIMNMDGLEWHRPKWTPLEKAWLWINEILGSKLAHHLVADHPGIKTHLMRHTRGSKISVIPYGADAVECSENPILPFELRSGQYILVVARPEPENSLLEIVTAYSARERKVQLVVLGTFSPDTISYHRAVFQAAHGNILFPGPLYDRKLLATLRSHARAYVHGHTVGGTNPSLVEALAAGNAILAHDNIFNRWVAGPSARYFSSTQALEAIYDEIEVNDSLLLGMRQGSLARHVETFTQDSIMGQYEQLLYRWHLEVCREDIVNELSGTARVNKTPVGPFNSAS